MSAAMTELSKTRVRDAVTLRDMLAALKTRVPYTEADRAELGHEACLCVSLHLLSLWRCDPLTRATRQPDAVRQASLHNKWRYQIAFYEVIEEFSEGMLTVVKEAPKMGTSNFLAMFPYDGAKGLYAEIEHDLRTEIEGKVHAEHQGDHNEDALRIEELERDLDSLRDEAQRAEAAAAALKVQLADAAKSLDAEKARSASLWGSLRKAQDEVLPESGSRMQHEDESMAVQLADISTQLREIRRNTATSGDKGKGAMSPADDVALEKGGMPKKRGHDVLTAASSSGTARNGILVKTPTSDLGQLEWSRRTDLLLTEMNHPNKGDVRNSDILDAFKQQLGRNLSTAELRMITHNDGPLLGVESAVYVGSAVSKTCRTDTDWYLQFHTFFLRFFQTLRKAYDDVSTQYSMAVEEERDEFRADMMARFVEINGSAKASMARKLFDLVAQHPVNGVNLTMIKRSLMNHWKAKANKWLTYDVELLGKETPLVLTAGASSGASAAKKPKKTDHNAGQERQARVLASKVLIEVGPMEGERAGPDPSTSNTPNDGNSSE